MSTRVKRQDNSKYHLKVHVYVLPNTNRTQARKPVHRRNIGRKTPFLSLVTLTFDLKIQNRPSEGPNTCSLWIWRNFVQQFRRYLTDEQKNKKNKLTYS